MPAKRIAVLSGAFNPLTKAHVALADAAFAHVDEVLCVVPRAYPHKLLEGATLEQRIQMLRRVPARYRVSTTEGGLFIDMARELRREEPASEIHFVCGRDAAERILNWDYGEPGFAEKMLEEFGLLVAGRQGHLNAPSHLEHRIRRLQVAGNFDEVSSTEIRRRIAADEPWEHLVPEEIVDLVREIYS